MLWKVIKRVKLKNIKKEGGTFEIKFYNTIIKLVYAFIGIEGKQWNYEEKKWAKSG